MLKFKGAIFDVDDTILDNKPGHPGQSLHERSRFRAVMTIADELNIPELKTLTAQENYDAFMTATVHSMEGAVWNILLMKGLVFNEAIDYSDERLVRIVRLKDELHAQVILDEAEEVLGATAFIKALADAGLKDKLAVASSAVRRDIDLFFSKSGLDDYFPPARIITKEDVEHTKPHPQVFEDAFKTLGLADKDKKCVLAFEDDPRGIMSAVAAGLSVCAITHRFTKKELSSLEIPPDFIIESYEEAYAIFGLR